MNSLNSNTIPTQYELRARLEEMVLLDLLGPAAGPDEEVTERSVRDRYLVGVLAPSRSTKPTDAKSDSTANESNDDDGDEELPLIPDPWPREGVIQPMMELPIRIRRW